jgi:hypothetical protein
MNLSTFGGRQMKGRVKSRAGLVIALVVVSFCAFGSVAHAQATRTWVSGVGDDANPCSHTAPCKTFAGAISKTATGGEIDVLDPGGFGAVTITKSISIESEGVIAGVLVSGTNGIVVNPTPGSVVVLRGLTFEGLGTGLSGILFNGSTGTLHVENCFINGFTQNGIAFTPTGASELFVNGVTTRDNTLNGIQIKPSGSGRASVTIDATHMVNNGQAGLLAEDGSTVTVRDSVVDGNNLGAFANSTTSGPVALTLESTVSASNTTDGVRSSGANAAVRISNLTDTANAVGLSATGGGQIISFGNNRVNGNTTNGSPTSTPGQI